MPILHYPFIEPHILVGGVSGVLAMFIVLNVFVLMYRPDRISMITAVNSDAYSLYVIGTFALLMMFEFLGFVVWQVLNDMNIQSVVIAMTGLIVIGHVAIVTTVYVHTMLFVPLQSRSYNESSRNYENEQEVRNT